MNKAKTNAVIIFSGGLDSSVLLYDLIAQENYNIHALTFHYGQRHSKEIDCARAICKENNIEHKVISLDFFKELTKGACALTDESIDVPTAKEALGDAQNDSYVPNRNMMLLSIAAAYAEAVDASEIFYGAGGDDEHSGYWDCTKEFRTNINNVIGLNRKNKIEIVSPYVELSKAEITKRGIDLNVPFEKTWTCYNGREKGCGKCTTCSNRIKSMMDNKVVDPISYEVDIPWEEYGCFDQHRRNLEPYERSLSV